ncbi:hypothetical protein SAMN02910456_02583 [Ruminococcaceae bacterium YRB3002]|nr:hypothetical protein SAMN02910456_02583 [Ruminococcaceae bacterium YRB3002]
MRKLISIALMICILTLSLMACNSQTDSSLPQATESTSVSSEETEETEATSQTPEASEDSQHPLSSIEFMRELIDEINQSDAQMEEQGYHPVRKILLMSFVEENTPYNRIEEIAAEGSGVHSTVAMRVEEGDSNESSVFAMTAVLLANGKPVSFRLNDNSSQDGVMTFPLNSNQDYIMSLSAEDLPAVEGANKLMLVVFGYSKDQDFYLESQSTTASFLSSTENDGVSAVTCPENEIDIVTIHDQSELGQYAQMDFLADGEMTDFQSDHYGNYLMTSRPEPTLHYYIDNMSDPGLYDNSEGIMFMLVDGELKPVWNGNCFGAISMKDGDLVKVIRLQSGFAAGEQHHIYWYYQETAGVSDWPLSTSYRMKMIIK